MATTTTTKAAKATKATKATTTYSASALPTTAVQYRNASGGTGTQQANNYKAATRALAKWAGKGTPNAALVHALVHLGWCAGAGARANCQRSNSVAYRNAANVLTTGTPAAPQVASTMQALHAAGAPAAALATVWATFTGTATA